MKSLNLNKFVKVSSDDNVTTLRHEAGHELKISHKNLSPEHRSQLEKLPTHAAKSKKPVQMFAEKGEVEPNPSDSQDSSDSSSPAKGVTINIGTPQQSTAESVGQKVGEFGRDAVMNSIPGLGLRAAAAAAPYLQQGLKGAEAGFTGQPADAAVPDAAPSPAPQAAPAAQPGLASAAAPTADQGVTPTKFQDLPNISPGSVYDAGNAANAMQLKADRAKAAGDLLAAQNHEAALRAAQTTFQDGTASMVQDIDGAIEDYKNGQGINPNHFMQSRGTVGKIATAIGLILGGVGGGLTHQENPASRFLNEQIDRDIDAQKADINKRHTLIGAYQKRYENFNVAESMARATELGLYATHLEEAAAKAADPAAQARALQAKHALMSQMLPLVQQAQMFHMMQQQSGLSQGQTGPVNYNKIRQLELMSNFKVPGAPSTEDLSAIEKESKQVEEARALRSMYKDSYDKLRSSFMSGALSPSMKAAEVNALGAKLATLTSHRYNNDEAHAQAEGMFPGKFDWSSTKDEKFRKGMQLFDSMEADIPKMKQFGVYNPPAASQSQQQNQPQNVREGATGTYQGKPVVFTGGKWQLKQ